MSNKKWFVLYCVSTFLVLIAISLVVIFVDPFFHYHKPVNSFYYKLDNERFMNDGITKHFSYNAIITGTSMTENFKTSEFDSLFQVDSIKVPYSGATFKEINDNLEVAFEYSDNLECIVRGLDIEHFFDESDYMRTDLGTYPDYLYNANLLDDVYYIYNKDIIFERCFPMLISYVKGEKGGITSFDEYENWMGNYSFGDNAVLNGISLFSEPTDIRMLTQEEKEIIIENIEKNVVALAEEHPETEFLYFIPPYSIVWWGKQYESGSINRIIEAEEIAISTILQCDNIKLYSWNDQFELTTDLGNYKDPTHYGEWINSYILTSMKNNVGWITQENYMQYLQREKNYYSEFDYNSLLIEDVDDNMDS